MNNVEFRTENLPLSDREQFLISCGRVLERVTAAAPSDGIVNLAVDYDGEDYLISLDVVSGDLNFAVVGEARSPFVALEKIHKESMERVKKWATSRKIEVA